MIHTQGQILLICWRDELHPSHYHVLPAVYFFNCKWRSSDSFLFLIAPNHPSLSMLVRDIVSSHPSIGWPFFLNPSSTYLSYFLFFFISCLARLILITFSTLFLLLAPNTVLSVSESDVAGTEFRARIKRASFCENKPKTLVFSHWKLAFWAVFPEIWVYKFGHRTVTEIVGNLGRPANASAISRPLPLILLHRLESVWMIYLYSRGPDLFRCRMVWLLPQGPNPYPLSYQQLFSLSMAIEIDFLHFVSIGLIIIYETKNGDFYIVVVFYNKSSDF